MVLHILKRDPTLRDLEHVQVDSPGTAYLFFYDKQGHRRLKQDVAENLWMHMAEAFSEWISHSAHFMAILLPLAEGWHCAVAVLEQYRHWLWTKCQGLAIPTLVSSESDSVPQFVGSASPSAVGVGSVEDNGGNKSARATSARPQQRPPKAQLMVGGLGNFLHHLQGGEELILMGTPL